MKTYINQIQLIPVAECSRGTDILQKTSLMGARSYRKRYRTKTSYLSCSCCSSAEEVKWKLTREDTIFDEGHVDTARIQRPACNTENAYSCSKQGQIFKYLKLAVPCLNLDNKLII